MTLTSHDRTTLEETDPWRGFAGTGWREGIDVRDFIQANVRRYDGDASFLSGPTARTTALWGRIAELLPKERAKGVLDVDWMTPSSITAHAPGYIDRDAELIVGLQTDAPLKRAIMPFGGWRLVMAELQTYGYPVSDELRRIFSEYRKTHNDAVFDVYPDAVLKARHSHLITGLPDAYGRGRIIGDYRRVALYGVDALIEAKRGERAELDRSWSSEEIIRDREELSEQIRALQELEAMAQSYGYDIGRPAATAREAVQWLYFGFLAAVKEQNGAAMSIGRNAAFLDVYLDRDLADGVLTETDAQELIDDLVIKLRIVRFLRTPDYDALFSGDPTWVTETLGGIGEDGRHLVTRTAFRYLQTLNDLGSAPEPNLTVLWNPALPDGWKRFCAETSVRTSAIQYENDDLIRGACGDDAAIACCVSPMRLGKQMQFFGARVNIAKALLYAINGGRDELTGELVIPDLEPIRGDRLDHDTVWNAYLTVLDWLAGRYVEALNCIHAMHDKYAYERIEMALHDREILRTMACGIAGLSVAADSLSAIRFAEVRPIRNADGLAVDYDVRGEFPSYGNDDDRADAIAVTIVQRFMGMLRQYQTYRGATVTQSVLTITSNVVYGAATGATPDGRAAGAPFAPGANPMNGRDTHGMLASALSVAKLPFADAQDGISLTSTIVPTGLGHDLPEQVGNLVGLLDAYTTAGGYHLNVNVLHRETLLDAMAHPEAYPNLTIRVSGYAVSFIRLTEQQQRDVISRTFHDAL